MVTVYLVDTYSKFATPAIVSVSVFRSVADFGFPLFAPSLYSALDYGWANTVLSLVFIVVCVPIPIMLWVFGEKWRRKSRFATTCSRSDESGGQEGSQSLNDGVSAGTTQVGIESLEDPSPPFEPSDWWLAGFCGPFDLIALGGFLSIALGCLTTIVQGRCIKSVLETS
jgi:hypothetical protein